jgi:hypothetical protein
MTVTTHNVRDVMRTYGRQVSRGRRLRSSRTQAIPPELTDQVKLSAEVRRRSVIETIAGQIVDNLTSHQPGLEKGVERQALEQLSQEVGYPLDVVEDEQTGQLAFVVVKPDTGEVAAMLTAEDSARLTDRLYQIISRTIDRNMV